MDTQNTPIHFKLWHRSFWYLAIANFFLTASVYALLPVLPFTLHAHHGGLMTVVYAFLAYCLGIYLPGPCISWLVQRFRRNHVCLFGILLLAGVIGFFSLTHNRLPIFLIIGALLLGVAYGLAKMTIVSTLIIDTCESFQRTEANHSSDWLGRLALAVGPFAGFWTYYKFGFGYVEFVALAFAALSFLFLSRVHFPFKAPGEDLHHMCLDRFFLPQGTMLFFNFMMATLAMGLIISTQQSCHFFLYMLAGFLLAIISEKYVFANANLKSETFVGCFVLAAALLLMLFRQERAATMIADAFCGFGIGILGSRFLLFFIKLAHHCERGTSQSTFFLSWETGMALGMALGWHLASREALVVALCLIVAALVIYNFLVHPWYLAHKNR